VKTKTEKTGIQLPTVSENKKKKTEKTGIQLPTVIEIYVRCRFHCELIALYFLEQIQFSIFLWLPI
jgi:hypothetical protein